MVKKIFILFILFILFITAVNGEVLLYEDFESYTDNNFPSSNWSHTGDASSTSWYVEETGALNGTKSLYMNPQSDKNTWEFLYHDKTDLPNSYCFYVNAKVLGAKTGAGFLGRNPTGDDGYSLIVQGETTGTDDARAHEWSSGSISDAKGDYNLDGIDMNNGDLTVLEGCFDGTTYSFNVTTGGNFDSDSYTDTTYTSGRVGFVAYVDSEGRQIMFDNLCIYNGTSIKSYCWEGEPAPPAPATSNNSVESVTHHDQQSPVTIKSTSYVEVFTGSFNATANAQLYGSWASNIHFLSGNPSSVSCRLNIDGVSYNDVVTRTNTGSGSYASIASTTTNFTFGTTTTHNATFECLGATNQNFEVLNTNFIIHQLIDNSGNPVHHKFIEIAATFNEASLTELGEILFNTTNTSISEGKKRTVIAEVPVKLNYTSTGNITGQIVIGNSTDNQTCAVIKRYGTAGSKGSSGSYCMWDNAPTEQEIFIKFLGFGNGDFSSNVIIKEFITDVNETGYTVVSGQDVTATAYTNITTINLNTSSTQDAVIKFAASVEGSTSQRLDFRIINSGNGTEMYRTVTAPNQAGVVLIQDAFKLVTGLQHLTIQAKTNTGTLTINEGDFLTYFAIDSPFIAKEFNVNLTNRLDDTLLTDFNVEVNGVVFTDSGTGTATITTGNPTVDLLITKAGYINETVTAHDTTTNLAAFITQPAIYNIDYNNFVYVSEDNLNYTRNLSYTLNYTCYEDTSIYLRVNEQLNKSLSLTCDGTYNLVTNSYLHNTESYFNTSFQFNTTYNGTLNNYNTSFNFFQADLLNPTITNISFVFSGGFVNPTANLTYVCLDNIENNLTYTNYINAGLLFNGTLTNGTLQQNTTDELINGVNTANFTCTDNFGTTSNITIRNIEIRNLFIIDEQKNLPFDVQNLSSVIVYLDDNRTSYDFKANAKNNISFVAESDVKLRFELIYGDSTIILRYVDIGLLTEDVRVCANTEGVTHYEQILTSSTTKPVILNSVFANCVVAADYTRFAYQNSKVLKAYTYNNLYYLYTFEGDDITQDQILLASVDGSIATFINLDSLEFIEEGYSINTVGDTLAVGKRNANEMEIYYYDVLQDNTALQITIERIDTSETLLNTTTFVDPNEAQILFNFATLTPAVNDTSLFRVTSVATDASGETSTTIKYFNINGTTGSINSGLIAIVSIIVLVFGLSFTVAQRTFAYFGIFIILINIAFLSFATAIWYITFLQAVNAIILIFTFLVLTGKNQVQIG